MKIAVVGAGAIGCFLAARLRDAGHDVILIGRQQQVDAIQEKGLKVKYADGVERIHNISTATSLSEPPDLILLTVKTQDVQQACGELMPHAVGTPVVAMQNGLQADRLAAEVLGRELLLGAVVMCAVSYLQPGEISVQFAGWLILGEPYAPISSRTHEIAEALNRAIPTYVTKNLRQARWSKLISNLNNGLCAATGMSLTEILNVPSARPLPVRVMKEGYEVCRAAGVKLDRGLYGLTPRALRQDPNAALISLLQGSMTGLLSTMPEPMVMRLMSYAGRSRLNTLAIRGSTWQSISRGRPTEIEYLNGEVSRLGRKLEVPTPYNDRVVRCVREVEETHRFVGINDLWPEERTDAHVRTQA